MNHRNHFADLKDKEPGHVLTPRDLEVLKTVWHELAGYKAAYDLETRRPFEDCNNQPGVRAAKVAAAQWDRWIEIRTGVGQMTEYQEEPHNPGKDDGRCALCQKTGLTEEYRCHGCGYLVCDDCDENAPFGSHLVVEHNEGDDDDLF